MTARWLAAPLVLLAFGGLAGCVYEPGGEAEPVADGAAATCQDGRADTALLATLREADESLRKALSVKAPDPRVAVERAIARGDFRLAAATTPDGINTGLYNAQCRLLGGLRPWTVRALAFVPDVAAAEGKGDDDAVTAFGRAYNAALMADARYPYRDVCRPAAEAGAAPEYLADVAIEQPYGFADLRKRSGRQTLAIAARHGAVSDIRRLLREDKGAIDRPDMFGLTPLAWAVAYHRWPAAELLLNSGASATGAVCQSVIDREAPLQIARIMRWDGMIRAMRGRVSEETFAALRQNPRYNDQGLADLNRALTELKDRYAKVLRKEPFSRHELRFEIDAQGTTTACTFEPASNSPEFDAELCEIAVKVMRWTPARDAFGVTVPADSKLVVGIGR